MIKQFIRVIAVIVCGFAVVPVHAANVAQSVNVTINLTHSVNLLLLRQL